MSRDRKGSKNVITVLAYGQDPGAWAEAKVLMILGAFVAVLGLIGFWRIGTNKKLDESEKLKAAGLYAAFLLVVAVVVYYFVNKYYLGVAGQSGGWAN